ncbi:MAG: hypothetical protein K6G15_05870 [Desulfovibrio sp.]|nr:hypothetical protein [Desulfovibrio sp.]
MILYCKDSRAESLLYGFCEPDLPPGTQRTAMRNIRINDQWRICFVWKEDRLP